MPSRQQKHDQVKHDQAVEDSFPASDPPATSGIVGPGTNHRARLRVGYGPSCDQYCPAVAASFLR